MTRTGISENALKLSVFALILVMVALQTFALRGLYADGAYFLVRVLENQSFFDTEPQRLFMYHFVEFPVVAAIKTGVTNLSFLTYLFCGWLSFSPLLFWMLGLWKLKDDFLFWPFLALFTFIYFNANFFIIGEYNLSYALSAFCFAYLLPDKKLQKFELAGLFVAAVILTMTYPSTLFMGVLLCFLALIKLRRDNSAGMKTYWLALTGIFIIAVGIGAWGAFFPSAQTNKAQALNFLILLNNPQIWSMGLCLAVAASQFFISSKTGKDLLFVGLLGIEILCLSGIFRSAPFISFLTRGIVGFSLFGGCVLIAALKLMKWPTLFSVERVRAFIPAYFFIPIFVLFVEMVLFDMQSSFAYHDYIQTFAKAANEHTGFIDHDILVVYAPDNKIYGWSWTSPSMSLILRDSPQGAIILNPAYGIPNQIYDPVTELPDLTRYYKGVR